MNKNILRFCAIYAKNAEINGDEMLIEFRVRNFRSFGDEAVLSLVASSDKSLAETNTTLTKTPSAQRTLRTAVVYGANASGKSNLLRAMAVMGGIVRESFALRPEQLLNVQPFRLSAALSTEPTLFEIMMTLDGVRYQYGFELTASRIVAEWLLVYQKTKPQTWFDRRYDPATEKETFEFGSHLAGNKRAWQDATRPNALFLSTAVQLNSDQLKPLHAWFVDSLVVSFDLGQIHPAYSTNIILDPEGHAAIKSILNAADIGISSISAVRQNNPIQQFWIDTATGRSETRTEPGETLVPHFHHLGQGTEAVFGYEDESRGTQTLFSLAGPLLDVIRNGRTFIIDELDRSLHPLLVRQIIKIFHDPESNPTGAQLIFSTHDTSLLDSNLFRRDQIWLTEKRVDQSSELIPLIEFSPRKGEALEKAYLGGRYGGVPILRERLLSGRTLG